MPPFFTIEDRKELSHFIINEEVPEIPDTWSDKFRNLVSMCLKKDPSERWTIDKVLESPLLTGLSNDYMVREACKEAWKQDVQAFIKWKTEFPEEYEED